jgi:uncharacterized protein (DUF2235 family)
MKRIIACSDGTWNRPNTKGKDGRSIKTNVQRVFDCVEKRDENGIVQIKYYDEGIGAQGNLFVRMFNGATGKGIDTNIKDVYKFICWNYEPGDQIYLFGFSRGAYTARSVAGLIRKCGIIKVNDLDLINDAYKLYRNKEEAPRGAMATKFRSDNSHEDISIKMIGVWDTVGSLGLPLHTLQWYNRKRYTFYDTRLSNIIEHAYHAIAVDERRKTFEPTHFIKNDDLPPGFEQVVEERWFPGVHSNVGGGYEDCGLSNIAMKWLFHKAECLGLRLDQGYKKIADEYKATLYNSRSGFFSLLPGRDRKVVIDDKTIFIDDSVYKRMELMGDGYKPVNVPARKV